MSMQLDADFLKGKCRDARMRRTSWPVAKGLPEKDAKTEAEKVLVKSKGGSDVGDGAKG